MTLESRRVGRATRGAYTIDDVALVKLGGPGPRIADKVLPRKKEAWEASVGGPLAASRLIEKRLTGWPQRLLTDRTTLPDTNREFVERLARDTWRGIEALTDRENYLPVDHVSLSRSLEPPGSEVADYTNITNVGLHLIAIAAAHELGFVSADEATRRVGQVLDTLGGLETHQGFFFNYYDTTSLERTSNFVSFVDSSWLTAGLMIVRTSFPAHEPRRQPRGVDE